MFGFDKMFDFNRNGKLDSWERAAQSQFMDEMMKDDEKSIFDGDDEIDTFADAGLDYDELEFMDPDERREVLEDAGMNLIYCKYYRKKKHYYVLNKKHFLHNWKKIVGGVPSGLMEKELM